MIRRIGGYALARVASGLLLYLTLVSLLYTLDKRSYEQFSAGYAAYQLVSSLVFGWIYAIIPHLISGLRPDEQARTQAELVTAFAWMCLLAVAAFVAASATGATDLPPLVLAAVAATAIAASGSEQAMSVAAARELPRLYLHIAVTRYAAGLLFALAAAAAAMGAAGAFFGLAAGSLIGLIVANRPLQLRAGGLKWVSGRQLGRLLATGLPAIIAFGIYPLAISMNRLAIAETCSLEAAAALGAVSDLVAGPVMLVFQVITLALMPALFGAANRGDAAAFNRTVWQLVGLQAAVIVPGAVFFLTFGRMIGSVLHLSSLPPVAADMLPYIAIAVLGFVLVNTAAAVALACKKMVLATSYGVLVIGISVALGLRENCDVLGIAKTLAVLMVLSSFVGLLFIYRLRNLPGRAQPQVTPEGKTDLPLPPAGG